MGRDPLVTEAGFLQRFDLSPEYGLFVDTGFLLHCPLRLGLGCIL